MSHDDHGHAKEPIIMTSPSRIGKGLTIVIVTLAVGAGILVPFFDDMFSNPPPVTQIRQPRPPPTDQPPAQAGTTTIAILEGASVQGNPDYDPDDAQVPLGNKIVWDNQDTLPHTATSGTGTDDPDSGSLFDTGIINGGDKSKAVELAGVAQGDTINYYCFVHPYMTAKLIITAAQEGGAPAGGSTGGADSSPAAATINILEGASVQGSPDFDPDQITAKKGDEIHVVNQDTLPHTITSGKSPSDPNSGKTFDTGIMEGGATAEIVLANVDAGDYDYFCLVHPYMTGKIKVE